MDLINQSYHFSCGKSSILQKIKPAKARERGFYEKSNDVRIVPVNFLVGRYIVLCSWRRGGRNWNTYFNKAVQSLVLIGVI